MGNISHHLTMEVLVIIITINNNNKKDRIAATITIMTNNIIIIVHINIKITLIRGIVIREYRLIIIHQAAEIRPTITDSISNTAIISERNPTMQIVVCNSILTIYLSNNHSIIIIIG